MPFVTVQANKILDKVLRGIDFAPAAFLFVSIHSADPGETGANEITGYIGARKAVVFNAAAAKHADSIGDIDFVNMPAVTVTHIGLWDAGALGAFWWGGALLIPKTFEAGDAIRFFSADIDVTLT